MDIEKLRFPIGKYNPGEITPEMINGWIEELRTFPARLTEVLKRVNAESLNYTYRPDGWNIQQLVHHLADSHMNSIIRFKWTLTEDHPTIKPYLENKWAMLQDVNKVPIEASLNILQGVHARLSALLDSMNESDFAKTFVHPEHGQIMNLSFLAGMYAWHGNHHLAHIELALREKRVHWK